MKKIFLVFALLILSCQVFAQATYYKYLQNTFDSTTAANYDTLNIQQIDKNYEYTNLTVENVGSAACTLAVRVGSFYRNADSWRAEEWDYPVTDTVWYQVPLIGKGDTTLTSLIIPTSGDAAETFLIKKQYIEAIKVYITNTASGKVKVLIEPTKPPK